MILLERVRKARIRRQEAEEGFRVAMQAARARHSWAEIARVAGLSKHGVRYHVEQENTKRRERTTDAVS